MTDERSIPQRFWDVVIHIKKAILNKEHFNPNNDKNSLRAVVWEAYNSKSLQSL